jgi:hypothetical protein
MTPEQHEALTRIDADRKRWMACELQVDYQISNAEASELVEEFFRDGAKPVGWAQFYIDGTILDFSDDPDEVASWKDEGLPVKPLFEHSEAVADAVSAESPPPSSHTTGLIEAAKGVIASASDTYKKRNGHLGSFEDESGEKCWIVPFDAFEALRSAIATTEGQP